MLVQESQNENIDINNIGNQSNNEIKSGNNISIQQENKSNSKVLLNEEEIELENPEKEPVIIENYVFKVVKTGKLGLSHKERILKLSKNGIEYYCMVEKSDDTKKFLDEMYKIYNPNNSEEKLLANFVELAKLFDKIPEEKKILKNKFEKYTINFNNDDSRSLFIVNNSLNTDNNNSNNLWVMDAGNEQFKNFINKADLNILKSKNELKEIKENTIYNKRQSRINRMELKLNDKKDEIIKDKLSNDKMIIISEFREKIKYIGIIYQGFMQEYLNVLCQFSKKRRESKEKLGIDKDDGIIESSQFFPIPRDSKFLNKNARIRKHTEMNIKSNVSKSEHSDKRDKDKDINDPLKEQISDTLKIAYLELAIYHCYDMFIKYCEKVVEKIVSHLYTFDKADDILKPNKLHPIVFPNPTNFTQISNNNEDKIDETSEPVLLYSIWGVNYTLTWNRLTYKFGDTIGTSGNWKKIKHNFQQKNYFQDLLMKLATIADSVENFPCIPMSCIIDYNGFRVYCEADIFASEEYLEGMRLQINKKDMEFLNNIISLISVSNNDENKKIENNDIYCKIKSEYIAEEKGFQLNQYIKTIIEDFMKSFNKVSQGSINNDVKKIDPFTEMQGQRPIINSITRLITEDRTIMGEDKRQFEDFQNDSFEFQKKCTFQYLMYFDVLIPIEIKSRKSETVYYRQELAINHIDFKEAIKQSHPKFFRNNEDDDLEFNDDYNMEEQSQESKNGSENSNMTQSNISGQNSRKKLNKKNSEEIKKKYKKPEEVIIDIIKQNTYQNNEKIRIDLKEVFDQKLNNLITALDSLYLIPYNSETLKLCFHHYGINLHYLGKVAEKTTVPHIREICVIEMFARVCKKLIFDILGQSTYDRAMKAFYSNIKELTTKLHCIPVSLNVLYGSNYLKSITQPVERGKCYYKNMEITGLYMNNEEYPLSELNFDKEKKINNETDFSLIKYQKINNFLILLFGGFMTKSDLVINGIEIKKSEDLWNLIKNLIRKQYEIINEDVFMYCDLETMSVYSLAGAIQYHTGLQFQNEIGNLLEKAMSQKTENVVFENLSPIPKKSYYSFTYFLCKENIILPLTNNFAMFFPDRTKYNKAKLNYYTEKFLYKKKVAHNYYYLYYLKILKDWDLESNPKTGKNQPKTDEFEKSFSNVNDYSSGQLSPIFEENFDSFIALIMSQYQPKTQRKIQRND